MHPQEPSQGDQVRGKVIPKLYQSYIKVPLRRELSGVWRQDVLGGVVRCVYTDGGVAEGQVVQGAWHFTVYCTVLYCTGGRGGVARPAPDLAP